MNQGVIRSRTSPCSLLIILVPKKDESWIMCVDYRALKKITIKNHYPLPQIYYIIDQLQGKRHFYKLYLRSEYHQVRIKEEDIWKTTLKTR